LDHIGEAHRIFTAPMSMLQINRVKWKEVERNEWNVRSGCLKEEAAEDSRNCVVNLSKAIWAWQDCGIFVTAQWQGSCIR